MQWHPRNLFVEILKPSIVSIDAWQIHSAIHCNRRVFPKIHLLFGQSFIICAVRALDNKSHLVYRRNIKFRFIVVIASAILNINIVTGADY